MTELLNAANIGDISNYVGDVAITMLFGVGYYMINKLKKDKGSKKEMAVATLNPDAKVESLEAFNQIVLNNSEKRAPELLKLLFCNSLQPNLQTYNLILFNSYKNEFYADAEAFAKDMFDIASPFTPNEETFSIILKGNHFKLGNKADISEFDNEYKNLKLQMRSRGIKDNLLFFNNYINILVEQNRQTDAWKEFKDNDDNSFFKYDIYTYICLLKGVFSAVLKSEASNDTFNMLDYIEERVKEKLIDKTNIAFAKEEEIIEYKCLMMKNYSAINNYEKVKQYYSKECEKSVVILISFYTKNQMFAEAIAAFDEFIKVCTKPNVYIFGAIINSACKSGEMRKAEELLSQMLKLEIFPNSQIYSCMISGYSNSNEIYLALQTFRLAELDLNNNSIVVVNSILNALAEHKMFKQLHLIFTKTANDKKIIPDKITFTTLIKAYSKSGEFDKLWDLYGFLKKNEIYDEILFNSMLDAFANVQHEENLYEIYSEMKRKKIPTSVYTFGVLLKLYVSNRNVERSEEIFNEILRKGIKPSIIIFQLMANLYSIQNNYSKVWQVYDSMLTQHKVQPDVQLSESIVKTMIHHGQFSKAGKVIIDTLYSGTNISQRTIEFFFKQLAYCNYLELKQLKNIAEKVLDAYNDCRVKLPYSCYQYLDSVLSTNNSYGKPVINKYSNTQKLTKDFKGNPFKAGQSIYS